MKKQVKTNVNLNTWELVALQQLINNKLESKLGGYIHQESLKSLYEKLQNVNP